MIAATPDRALQVLPLRDLRDVKLSDDELFFSAVVDGAGAVIVADDAERLSTAIKKIADASRAAGLIVGDGF